MDKEKKYKIPEVKPGDVGYAVVNAGISSLPIVGALASELLGLIVTPPLEKRRSEWMELVGNGLRELEQKMNIVLEDLRDNDKFIDAAMDATQIAIRTSRDEKIKALRNALLNAALPNSPEESVQKMFFSFIDIFTDFHLSFLDLFRNPPLWFEKHSKQFPSVSSLNQLIENGFPMLIGKRSFYDQVWKDLYLRGLVSTDGLHSMMTSNGTMAKRTSEWGDSFLNFISNPL
jgi:hypothetical protein